MTHPLHWLTRLASALWRGLTWPGRWLWERWRATSIYQFFTETPEEASVVDTLGDAIESRDALQGLLLGFGEHLDALRRHIFRALLALLVTTAFSFWFADQLMALLAMPLGESPQATIYKLTTQSAGEIIPTLLTLGHAGLDTLQVIEPTESIGVFMRVALLAGLALAMPWIIFELYFFIAPGLMPPTRQTLFIALPAASLLFTVGLLFTYFVMLPAAIPFLYTFGDFRVAWRPEKYFELVTGLMFWVGVAFQMPLIIYALAAAGWIRASQLAAQWRLAVIAIAVLAAMITPTVDPVNMLLVMLPMVLLYGVSIIGAWVAQGIRRREKQAARPVA